MLTITAYENALHYLAQALAAFRSFHNDGGRNKFYLKNTITFSFQGLETMSKYLLVRLNPVFIFEESYKIPEIISVLSEYTSGRDRSLQIRSVGAAAAFERVHKIFGAILFMEGEYEQIKSSIEALARYRNALNHYEFTGNEEQIALQVGQSIPRFIELCDRIFQLTGIYGTPMSGRPNFLVPHRMIEDLIQIEPEARETIKLLKEDYDQIYKEAIEFINHNIGPTVRMILKAKCETAGSSRDVAIITVTEPFNLNIDSMYMSIFTSIYGSKTPDDRNRDFFGDMIPAVYDLIDCKSKHKTDRISDNEDRIAILCSMKIINLEKYWLTDDIKEKLKFIRLFIFEIEIGITRYTTTRLPSPFIDTDWKEPSLSGRFIFVPYGVGDDETAKHLIWEFSAQTDTIDLKAGRVSSFARDDDRMEFDLKFNTECRLKHYKYHKK